MRGVLRAGSANSDYDGTTDLTPFIATASATVDRVANCAIRKRQALSAVELELVERWLAAALYQCADRGYQSRSNQGASGQFTGETGQGYEATQYGQEAMRIDWSGCLRNLDKQQRARALGPFGRQDCRR